MDLFAAEPQHVLFPLLTPREVDALIVRHGPDKAGELIQADCRNRREQIAQAERNPVRYMPRPKVWKAARKLIHG